MSQHSMGFMAWRMRGESLGIFLHPNAEIVAHPRHVRVGDRLHRMCVRDARVPLVVFISVQVPLRSVCAVLCSGGRVAGIADDRDDIVVFLRRLCLVAPALVQTLPCVCYKRDDCQFEGTLGALATYRPYA